MSNPKRSNRLLPRDSEKIAFFPLTPVLKWGSLVVMRYILILLVFVAGCSEATSDSKPRTLTEIVGQYDNSSFYILLRIFEGVTTPAGRKLLAARYGGDDPYLSDPNFYIPPDDFDKEAYLAKLDKIIEDNKTEEFRRELLSATRQQNQSHNQQLQEIQRQLDHAEFQRQVQRSRDWVGLK